MKTIIYVMLTFLLINTIKNQTVSPGLVLTAQDSFFTEVTSSITPILEKVIIGAPIPNQSGEKYIFPIGKLSYDISNINITSFDFSNDNFGIIPNTGVQLETQDASGDIYFDWKWEREGIIKISDSGNGKITFDKASFDLEVQVTDVDEKLALSCNKAKLELGHLDIHLSGTWDSFLYDFFIWLFNFIIKDIIQGTVDSTVQQVINKNVNDIFQNAPLLLPLYDGPSGNLSLNTALANPPIFTSYASLQYVGDILYNNQPPPFVSQSDLPANCSNLEINVLFDSFLFDSTSYAIYKSNILDFQLNNNTFPELNYLYNTSSWKLIIPNLEKHYPNQALTLDIEEVDTATLNITQTDGFKGNVDFDVNFLIKNQSSYNNVLVIDANVDFDVDLYLNDSETDNILHISVDVSKLKFKVQSSTIGHVDLFLFNTGASVIVKDIIVPVFNDIFSKHGIPLPSLPGVTFVQPNFLYYDNYVCLESSFEINL